MSLYQRIADHVARDIRAGVLAPGARLPSLRAVCEREGVSLMTLDAGIAIVPGSVFSLTTGLERFIRLSTGTDPAAARAVERLGTLVRAQLAAR